MNYARMAGDVVGGCYLITVVFVVTISLGCELGAANSRSHWPNDSRIATDIATRNECVEHARAHERPVRS